MRVRRRVGLMVTGVELAILILSLGLNLAPAAAVSTSISHAYPANSAVRPGSIVSIGQNGSVAPANTDTAEQLLGATVSDSDSLIAIDASPDTVQVVTSGSASVLVSDLNGDIHAGDLIGVSPFNGIGMKAAPGSKAVGTAQTGFNQQTPAAVKKQVTDKNGKGTAVSVGYARVNIAIATAPGRIATHAVGRVAVLISLVVIGVILLVFFLRRKV